MRPVLERLEEVVVEDGDVGLGAQQSVRKARAVAVPSFDGLAWAHQLIAQSPPVKLRPYFGETAQFPLERTIPIRKGDIVALAVPTWAPALALGFGHETSWRASRPRKSCSSTSSQSTQTVVGSAVQYICLYQTARLTYSATLISTP